MLPSTKPMASARCFASGDHTTLIAVPARSRREQVTRRRWLANTRTHGARRARSSSGPARRASARRAIRSVVVLRRLPMPPNPASPATSTPNGSTGPVAASATSSGKLPPATNPQSPTRRAESVSRVWPRSRRVSNQPNRRPPTATTTRHRTATATSSRAPKMEDGTNPLASPTASEPVARTASATPHVMAVPTRPRNRR